MIGWIKNKVNQSFIKSIKTDITTFTFAVKAMTGEELGLVLYQATRFRVLVLQEEMGLCENDFGIFPSNVSGVAACQWQIRLEIGRLQKGDDVDKAMAGAWMVWLHTLRCNGYPAELRYYGQQLWKELQRGMNEAASLDAEIDNNDFPSNEYCFTPEGFEEPH